MGLLSKADILGCNQFPTETIDVVGWGGKVRVRALSVREFRAVSKAAGGDDEVFAVHIVAASIVDEKDALVFKPNDVMAMMDAQWSAIDQVFKVTLRLNGFGEDAIGDAAKNSDGTSLNSSGASSPSPSESLSEN